MEKEFNLHKKAVKKAKKNYPEAFKDYPKEFNLSEREINQFEQEDIIQGHTYGVYFKEDIKEFIKRLNKAAETIKDSIDNQFMRKMIFELSGEELI